MKEGDCWGSISENGGASPKISNFVQIRIFNKIRPSDIFGCFIDAGFWYTNLKFF